MRKGISPGPVCLGWSNRPRGLCLKSDRFRLKERQNPGIDCLLDRISVPEDGAGRRNRTDIIGFVGRCFTNKLYPRRLLLFVKYPGRPSRFS